MCGSPFVSRALQELESNNCSHRQLAVNDLLLGFFPPHAEWSVWV